MFLKTVVWTALCLSLCTADRIRILSSDADIQADPVARNAFKSKIRSLTLKSSIERALSDLANEHSSRHRTATKAIADTHFSAVNFAATTTDAYNDGLPSSSASSSTSTSSTSASSTSPSSNSTSSPGSTTTAQETGILSGCFRLVKCCCNDTAPTSATTKAPYVTPKPPCGSGYPPQPYQTGPIQPYQPGSSSCSSCCSVAVSTPCYVCPCISQCSILPASGCPCAPDRSVEYQCPNVQPHGVLLHELNDWINQGYRLLDNLRAPPECAYIPGSVPDGSGAYVPATYNTQPVPYVGHYKAEVPSNFVALAQGLDHPSQSANNFPFRQLRQRSFSQQVGGYQLGPRPSIGGYPVQPQPGSRPPIGGYPVQPQPGPRPPIGGYPIGPPGSHPPIGGYPIGPPGLHYPVPPAHPVTAQYAHPTTTTLHTTTASSGVVYLVSSSAVAVSLVTLVATALLIK